MGIVLLHKERGSAALKDTQKVWLCAVPSDHRKYGRVLAEELMDCRSSISVWYPADPGQEISGSELRAYLDDLKQMQLFVIPVTAEFLTTDNRARLTEMQLAIDNGIPVLPVFVEPGLDEKFNSVCGNLQCLDRCNDDPTALPFNVKLASFLDSVLLNDELVSRIRQSFAAYIFLSYRKKDRDHAQEIMRLIHKNEYSRDIAIWYDEFLTPGEDFNDSIREALRKSGLVSLVVTPNFLEDPNYVKDHEYPEARDSGKPIMPVMAVPTDPDALQNAFKGLPECIVADENASEAVERMIKSALKIKRDDSPEHKFFMGLAYLSGIDVESDHERALKLITEAAEGGLNEACSRLASMYRSGMGVKRDYGKAAFWQQRYSDALEAEVKPETKDSPLSDDDFYRMSAAEYDLRNEEKRRYIQACREASDLWRLAGDPERAWADIDRLMDLDSKHLDQEASLELIDAYMLAIRMSMKEKELDRGRRLCDEMLEFGERKLFFESSRKTVRGTIYQYRGLLALEEEDWETAIESLRKASDTFWNVEDWGFRSDMGERRYAESRSAKIDYVQNEYNLAVAILRSGRGDEAKRAEARSIYKTVIDLYNQIGYDGAEGLTEAIWAGSWSGLAEIIFIEEGWEKSAEYSRDILAKAVRQYGILQSEATLMYLKAACSTMAETLTRPEAPGNNLLVLAELFTVRKRQADLYRGENTGEADEYDKMANSAMIRFMSRAQSLLETRGEGPLWLVYNKYLELHEKYPSDPYVAEVYRVIGSHPALL